MKEGMEQIKERADLENAPSFYKKIELKKDEKENELLELTVKIAEAVKAAGGRALVVGGYARDEVLQKLGYAIKPKDIDIEVHGIEPSVLESILCRFGKPETVGGSFSVIKLKGLDISLPLENSHGLDFAEAARRRDFTINALGLDPLTGEILDEFGGLDDLKNKTLRMVDPETFKQDPLRVLRAAQFAGRFGFSIDQETVEFCKTLDLKNLPPERLGEEWAKLILKSSRPSLGLEAAKELGVLERLHPELDILAGAEQDPGWHPEGDVWEHTKLSADAAAKIISEKKIDSETALVIMLAVLCHDLGKPAVTRTDENGKIKAHGHAEAGIAPAKNFLKTINNANSGDGAAEKVLALVKEHMFPHQNKEATDAAVRRLALRLHPATIEDLVLVVQADKNGTTASEKDFSELDLLLKKAEELKIDKEKPQPVLLGRHLLEMGFAPGPNIGKILKAVYELQLDGEIKTLDEAKQKAAEFKNLRN